MYVSDVSSWHVYVIWWLLAQLIGVCVTHVHRVDLLFVANSLSPPQFCSHEITAHIPPLCSPSVNSQPCGSFTTLFPVPLWRKEAYWPLILTTQHLTIICCHCLFDWVYKRSPHSHEKHECAQVSHCYIMRFGLLTTLVKENQQWQYFTLKKKTHN